MLLGAWGSDRTDTLGIYLKNTAFPIWIYTRETENKSSFYSMKMYTFAQNLKGASIGRQLNVMFTYLSVCACVSACICVCVCVSSCICVCVCEGLLAEMVRRIGAITQSASP